MTTAMQAALRRAIVAAGWDATPPRDPQDATDYLAVLRVLYETGRQDLPLGRLLEGHVDAAQIVQRFGTIEQRQCLGEAIANGALLGVWNAGLPDEPLLLEGDALRGGKAYASGAGILSHALVTADAGAGTQFILLDLEQTSPMVDRDWWRVTGMQRSETHIVRWNGQRVGANDLIGSSGIYATEPFFSSGALRFVAVQAGGIAGLFDRTRDHLLAVGRAGDPFQAARLADLFGLAESAANIVRRATELSFREADEARIARVASARLSIVFAAERAIDLAQQAVGLQGMFVDHPLSANLTDLAVYLRQPAPDAQRLRVGQAAASGALSPAL